MGIYGDLDATLIVGLGDLLLLLDVLEGDMGGYTIEELELAPCDPNHFLGLNELLALLDRLEGSPFPCPNPCP